MTRFVLAFAMLISFSCTGFSQIPLPPACPSSSPNIIDNCNGTFTAAPADRYRWEIEYSPWGIALSLTDQQTVVVTTSSPFPTAFGLKLTSKVGGVTTIECIHAIANPGPIQYSIEEVRPICNQRNAPCGLKAGEFRLLGSCGGYVSADWSFSSASTCIEAECPPDPFSPSLGTDNVPVFRPTSTCYSIGQLVTIYAYQPGTSNLWASFTTTVVDCGLIPLENGKSPLQDGEALTAYHSGQLKAIATDLITGQQFTLKTRTVERGERIDLQNEMKSLENGHLYDIRVTLDGETIHSRKVRRD